MAGRLRWRQVGGGRLAVTVAAVSLDRSRGGDCRLAVAADVGSMAVAGCGMTIGPAFMQQQNFLEQVMAIGYCCSLMASMITLCVLSLSRPFTHMRSFSFIQFFVACFSCAPIRSFL